MNVKHAGVGLVATARQLKQAIPRAMVIPIAISVALTAVVFVVSEFNYLTTSDSLRNLREEQERIDQVKKFSEILLGAETGQRTFLLTGNEQFLAPLRMANVALPRLQDEIAIGLANRPDRLASIAGIRDVIDARLRELAAGVQLAAAGNTSGAVALIASPESSHRIDETNKRMATIAADMSAELAVNRAHLEKSMLLGRIGVLVVAAVNMLLLGLVVNLLARDQALKARIASLRESENLRLGEEVASRTNELNELSTHLQRTTEKDKATLARDLHDELGGILTSAKMDIDWLHTHSPKNADMEKRFVQLDTLLDDAVSVKRRVVESLRPSLLDNLGLGPAIEWYVTEQCDRAGLQCTLNIADDLATIPSDSAIALYRIVQEAMTNVLRHAAAQNFAISLRGDTRTIRLTIRDDGKGMPRSFNAASLTHGLAGMRQRARALGGEILWVAENGTTIEVLIPLAPQAMAEA